jgi:adhesin transport system membrane fusion protein
MKNNLRITSVLNSLKNFTMKVLSYYGILNSSIDPGGRYIFRSILSLLVIFFLWSIFFSIDQVVLANGKIIAISKTQIIQSYAGGTVEQLNVKEGDFVKKGEILALLNKDKVSASYNETMAKATALRIAKERVNAEISNSPVLKINLNNYIDFSELVNNQTNLFIKRRKSFVEQGEVLKKSLDNLEAELDIYKKLELIGEVSKSEVLKISKQTNDAKGEYVSYVNKYYQDLQFELNKIHEDLTVIEEVLADKKLALDGVVIVSPVDGYVKNIKITTIGGVLKSGETLMEIVPTDSGLIIEAKLSPSKVGFIREGQTVNIKFDAYDYSIYGTVPGTITYLSPDSLADSQVKAEDDAMFYRIQVEINDPISKNLMSKLIELKPGLTASLDIKITKRSILSLLTRPVVKTLNESFVK